VRISGSNAGYNMFRGSAKSTGFPMHSPVSPFNSSPLRQSVPSHFYWSLLIRVERFSLGQGVHVGTICYLVPSLFRLPVFATRAISCFGTVRFVRWRWTGAIRVGIEMDWRSPCGNGDRLAQSVWGWRLTGAVRVGMEVDWRSPCVDGDGLAQSVWGWRSTGAVRVGMEIDWRSPCGDGDGLARSVWGWRWTGAVRVGMEIDWRSPCGDGDGLAQSVWEWRWTGAVRVGMEVDWRNP